MTVITRGVTSACTNRTVPKTPLINRTIISAAIAIAAAAIYFVAWSLLASPFRAFPSDDGHVASNLIDIAGSTLGYLSALNYSNPVYYLLDYSVFRFCDVIVPAGCDPGEVILRIAVASNAAIVLLLGLLVFMLTRSLFAQVAVQVVYAFAAWPVTYHFMVSYTVTTAALALLVFCLIIGSSQGARLRPGIAGIATGLVLWSSSSGPLTTGVLIITVVLLLWDGCGWRELLVPSRYDWRRLGFFAAGFLACAAFFGYFGLQPYIEHLIHNINSDHSAGAYRRFGYVPEPPLFSYAHILDVYGRTGLLISVIALTAVPFLAGKMIRVKIHKRAVQAVIAFGMFVVLHAILIDSLPTTKLGRTHFPAYPVSLAVICIAGFLMYAWLKEATRERRALPMLLLFGLVAMIYEGVHMSAETWRVRTAAAQYMNDLRPTAKFYVLRDDPHQWQMRITFDWQLYRYGPPAVSDQGQSFVELVPRGSRDQMIDVLEDKVLPSLLEKPRRTGLALLLGPHGHGSGLSVAAFAMGPDFYPGKMPDLRMLNSEIKEVRVLPYYMHYPPFLLEEEICQALYFDGKIPDYRNPYMGITVLRF